MAPFCKPIYRMTLVIVMYIYMCVCVVSSHCTETYQQTHDITISACNQSLFHVAGDAPTL